MTASPAAPTALYASSESPRICAIVMESDRSRHHDAHDERPVPSLTRRRRAILQRGQGKTRSPSCVAAALAYRTW